MSYKFWSLKQVLDLFYDDIQLWPTEISEKLWKSRVVIHKYLNELVKQKKIKKINNPPNTKYKKNSPKSLLIRGTWRKDYQKNIEINTDKNILIKSPKDESFTNITEKENRNSIKKSKYSYQTKKIINEIFLKFTPEWNILEGFEGFMKWCKTRDLNIEEKIKNYISIYNYIWDISNFCWLLNAKNIFLKNYKNMRLDKIYYADQYRRMEFWRSKLAELTFYWKQSQNKELIYKSIKEIIPKLECFILQENFSAIAIIPWSIDRKNQILKILKNELKRFELPFVNVIKYYPNNIAIPQKTLKTKNQRIQNARNTIFIDDKNIKNYSKILLIDDFVWSGSTLNETAIKLKNEWVDRIFWFAFVWNMDLDYEVICEI